MNARRYCVVNAPTAVAGCVGDLMAADTPILAAPLKPARTEVTMNDIAGEKITWIGVHLGTA